VPAYNKQNTDAPFGNMAQLKLWEKDSCGRSIVFAASWYVPCAAKE
jgi:hypothetical protein